MSREKKDADHGNTIFNRIWQRFGEVAKKLGLVGDADVRKALARQETSETHKKVGEILVESGKLSRRHVDKVLDHQKAATKKAKAARSKKTARTVARKSLAKKKTAVTKTARSVAKKAKGAAKAGAKPKKK